MLGNLIVSLSKSVIGDKSFCSHKVNHFTVVATVAENNAYKKQFMTLLLGNTHNNSSATHGYLWKNFRAKVTNSIPKVTNSIAKGTNSFANRTNNKKLINN